MFRYIAILSVIGLYQVTVAQQGVCSGLTPCACQYDDGTIMDLSAIASNDSSPRFANVKDSTGDLFSWNPCKPFTYTANHSECIDVAVCLIRPGIPNELVYSLGTQNTANFSMKNDRLFLTYTAQNEGFTRQARIELLCSEFEFFTPKGEEETTRIYDLVLASPHACVNHVKIQPANTPSSTLSGGTIFIIVLATLVGAYIILGMAYQKIVNKETGVKIFPNHGFWCVMLPDGVKAAVTCKLCKSSEGERKYDNI